MKRSLSIFFFFFSTPLFAQLNLHGAVMDENGIALASVSAALLNPSDSTLDYFGISNATGDFEIREVSPGKYLLQLACIGYQTRFVPLELTAGSEQDLGVLIVPALPVMLDSVEVKAERIPLQLKGDTLEYNTYAFKTQPDASVEDLLKKFPGIQVDQAGNIKAQGESVNQVLVDGKEFFSSDPKVATKNLPADAVRKVQVFDKQSEEADFTGIDDGSRSKTINLLLKDDKKSAWLGNVTAGAGTASHYQAAAKLYRFTKSDQFAALGMLNNINQFGFSFNDYIDFNGGIGSMMNGGGMRLETGDDAMPLNFGQQVNGLVTSGAAGLNFTHEAMPGNRINVSYLGNGYDKQLSQTSLSQNFAPGFTFATSAGTLQQSLSVGNRINFNCRNAPDSLQRLFANGSLAFNGRRINDSTQTENFSADSLTNLLKSISYERTGSVKGNATLTYLRKNRNGENVFRVELTSSAQSSLTRSEWKNLTAYFPDAAEDSSRQYRDDHNSTVDYSTGFSWQHQLNSKFYLVPLLRIGGTHEILNREQGMPAPDDTPVDSLSPGFARNDLWIQPGVALRFSSKKTQWRLSLAAKGITLSDKLDNDAAQHQYDIYIVPQISLSKEIRRGSRLEFSYDASVNAPEANQLLPVTNNINPLQLFTGNRSLKPEYASNLSATWMLFDQFSFTSLFTSLRVGYIKDKINFSRTIQNDLSQSLTLVNVPGEYSATAGADFSTPFRPAGLNIHLSLEEHFGRGISFINSEKNIINSFTHGINLSIDNRKKDKIDATLGSGIELTNAAYSVQSAMNYHYFNWSYFFEMHYMPSKQWTFSFNADVNHYGVDGFDVSTLVPLIRAEVSRYLLKSNRGTITLSVFDLLDKNAGITQTSELNYLMQQQSNTIGRYAMLSFRYRINKADQGNGGVDIKVNGR
ncbi:MAG: TonB-dependent receptor [Chitinophagales bacterium]|nr:TonB-dependent receptor [Chitinophagales bacterium]